MPGIRINGSRTIEGTLDVEGIAKFGQRIQVTGDALPTADTGVEIGHDGTRGIMVSYDRTGASYKDMQYNALNHIFSTGGTEGARIASTGLTLSEARNIAVGTTTGTKIGTATTQKLSVYNATPVVQGVSIADASGGATIDAEARTALNALLAYVRSFGLIAP